MAKRDDQKRFKIQQLEKQLEAYATACRAYPFNEKYRRAYNRIQCQLAKLRRPR